MRKVTLEEFSKLDRDISGIICFLFNEPCGIGRLYRELHQHSKLNFKLLIEILRLCGFVSRANVIQAELDTYEEFKREDETLYETTKEKLDKSGDTVLTGKHFEFRVKLIEIQLLLSKQELYQVKVHFGLNNNEGTDYPSFIDVIKFVERKVLDHFNPYRIVTMIQTCLRETLHKSGPILKKLDGFYDLYLKHEKLNNIGIGVSVGTLRILAFLFNLDCGLVLDWTTLVSELKLQGIFNFNILAHFLQLCGEYPKSTEVADYATQFPLIENYVSHQTVVEATLSATHGDLCHRSLEFRCLLVSFSVSNNFTDINEILERFELPRENAATCVTLLDVVIATRFVKPKDLFLILIDTLKYFGHFKSEIQQLEEFYERNTALVDSCSSTYH